MLFCLMLVLDSGLQIVLGLLPFYYILRTLLLVYLFKYGGAMKVYESVKQMFK